MDSPFKDTILQGKVGLITGGGSGLGLEIAVQYGLHGCKVALMGRREQVLRKAVEDLQAQGIQATFFQGDVRKKEDANGAVKECIERFGRLDILINGAAGNFLAASEDLSVNAFRTVLEIDAVGTFCMCLAARPYLAKGAQGKDASEGGLILNISATLHYSAGWYQTHLNAAKAAVDATTRNLALEWGTDYGIRCNVIAPGPIGNTPGMAKLAPQEAGLEPGKIIPLGGAMGESWDIAMAALYLGSPAAKFVSGATLVVDGAGWLYHPRYVPKESIRDFSRSVEKRSRAPTGQDQQRSKL